MQPRRAPPLDVETRGRAWTPCTLLLCMSLTALAHAQAATPTLAPPELRVATELRLPPDAEPLIAPGPDAAAVLLLLTLDESGAVVDVQIEQSLRDDVDALALSLARELRFSPARRDGRAIGAKIRFRYALAGAQQGQSHAAHAEPPSSRATQAQVGADAADDGTAAIVSISEPLSSSADVESEMYSARAVIDRPQPGAATQIRLRHEELTAVPGTFGEPLRVVATLPGVARTPFGLGYFLVRGASFENTGFFVDGFPVPILYHLGAGPAVLSSRLVQGLDFYPGGYPASYGRFLGGVIALKTGPPPSEGFRGELEVDAFRASALTVIPFQAGRGTLTLAYRRSYFDLILPLVVDGFDLFYQDWQARLDYRVRSNVRASLFWFGSEDALEISESGGVSDSGTNTNLNYRFHRLIGSLSWRISDATLLKWSSTLGFDRTRVGRTSPGDDRLGSRLDGTTLGERVELEARTGDALTHTIGVDTLALLYEVETPLPLPDGLGRIEPPIPSFNSGSVSPSVRLSPTTLSVAPYAQSVLRWQGLELTGGVRFDYLRYANVSTPAIDPRAVVRYRLSDAITLKAASGLFAQPALPFQIDRTLGNPDLRPQRSWQTSGGVELTLPHAIEVQSQLFYSQMRQLGRTTPQIVERPDGTRRRLVFVDDGEGRAYGWELMLRRKLDDGLFGWLSYTLSWSERYLSGGDVVPFLFDQRHVMNLALSYRSGSWRFGARLQLATGRPDRPLRGAANDVDENDYDPIRGGLTGRLPAFHQLDVRVDHDFVWSKHVRGSWYIDVINVLNAANTEGYLYQYDFEQRANLPSLPILPTLGLRLEYQ